MFRKRRPQQRATRARSLTDTARAWAKCDTKQHCPQWTGERVHSDDDTEGSSALPARTTGSTASTTGERHRPRRAQRPATRKAGRQGHAGSSMPRAAAGGRDSRGTRRGSGSGRRGGRKQQMCRSHSGQRARGPDGCAGPSAQAQHQQQSRASNSQSLAAGGRSHGTSEPRSASTSWSSQEQTAGRMATRSKECRG